MGRSSVGRSLSEELDRLYLQLAENPWQLQRELQRWDKGSKYVRAQMLKAFIVRNTHKTGPQLEKEFGNGASLFLTRVSSWLRLTHLIGFALSLQLDVITIFIAASSGHRFLTEFLEVGGVVTVLEILRSCERIKDNDKLKALQLLLAIANAGRHYKELVCEHSGAQVVVESMIASKDETLQEEARILLLNLGRGNPRFQVHVAESVLSLLGCGNPVAQRMGAQSTRQYMQTLPPGFDYVTSCIPMLQSSDLQVQYEASELMRALSKYAYLHEAIVENLVAVLASEIPPKDDTVDTEVEKTQSNSPHRVMLRCQGSACKVLGMLSSSHPALMPIMVTHGVMAYVANALTTMDYECIQHASGALSNFCKESTEAEAICEQLLTEPLVYSVKQDHLRFYRELEPDVVQGIVMRAGHLIEARKEETARDSVRTQLLSKTNVDQNNSEAQVEQLNAELQVGSL